MPTPTPAPTAGTVRVDIYARRAIYPILIREVVGRAGYWGRLSARCVPAVTAGACSGLAFAETALDEGRDAAQGELARRSSPRGLVARLTDRGSLLWQSAADLRNARWFGARPVQLRLERPEFLGEVADLPEDLLDLAHLIAVH